MTGLLFRLSRRMIGGRLADELKLPGKVSTGAIALVRLRRRCRKLRGMLPVWGGQDPDAANLVDLLEQSRLDDGEKGFSYRLPEAARSELAGRW